MIGSTCMRATILNNPFTPRSIPGSRYWFCADLGVTLATGVSAWADQSGEGRDLVQATAGSQPALDTAWRNGRRALIGLNGRTMASAFGILAGVSTEYCVVQWPSTVAAQRMVYDGTGASDRILLATDGTALNPGSLLYAGNGVAGGSTPSGPVIFRAIYNGVSSSLRAEPHGAAVVSSSGNAGASSRDGLTVLSNFLGGSPFEGGGKLACLIAYSGLLTATQDAAVLKYLADTYGIFHT